MRRGLGGVAAAFLLAASTLRAAASPKPPSNDDCLTCHSDPSAARADGSSVLVDPKVFGASVHGQAGASCVDCHTDLAKSADFPHPEKLGKPDCSACHAQQVEDYGKSQSHDRERLLLACAHISAGHRKYGDFFEAGRRFGEAMGLAELH